MLGVRAEGEIIQHVALFLDFNCSCSAYSPSVQVTHASGCTSAKVKILDSHNIHNKNVKCYEVKNEMNFKLSVCLSSLHCYRWHLLKSCCSNCLDKYQLTWNRLLCFHSTHQKAHKYIDFSLVECKYTQKLQVGCN